MKEEIIIINGFGVNSFGIELLCFLLIFYMLLIVFDYTLGIMAARIKQVVSSRVNTKGTLLKGCIVCFILLILFFVIGITNILDLKDNAFLVFSLVPSIFMSLFILGEITSIIEKLAIIFSNKRSGAIFNILNYLSQKIFNLTLEKLKEKVETKIDEKVDNIYLN